MSHSDSPRDPSAWPRPAALALAILLALVVILLASVVYLRQPTVRLGELKPLADGSSVVVNGEIAVAVQDVDNPRRLLLEYQWAATRGTFRVASANVPAVTFIAGDEAGVETVTLEVFHQDKLLDTRSMQVDVVDPGAAAPTAKAPAPDRGGSPTVGAATQGASRGTPTMVAPTPAPAVPTAERRTACAPSWQPLTLTAYPGSGTIDLDQCQTVPAVVNLHGRFANVPEALDVWLLISPHGGDEQWWPQAGLNTIGPALKIDADTWESIASFGAPDAWFDVVLVVADADATQAFRDWHDRGRATNDYPGWTRATLPAGIDQKAVVTVYRGR